MFCGWIGCLLLWKCGKKYFINPNPFYFYQAKKRDLFLPQKPKSYLLQKVWWTVSEGKGSKIQNCLICCAFQKSAFILKWCLFQNNYIVTVPLTLYHLRVVQASYITFSISLKFLYKPLYSYDFDDWLFPEEKALGEMWQCLEQPHF